MIGEEAGVHEINHTYRASVGDIGGDGREDLIVIPHWADFPRVYLNQGDGSFIDVAPGFEGEWARPRDRHDCEIGDVDGDGGADIFCTVGGGGGGTRPNPSELWLQREDGSFAHADDVEGFELGPAADPFGRSRDAVFLDANGNGRLDLYIQNSYPRRDGRSPNSRLFINVGGERYVHAGERGISGANVPVGGSNLQAIDYDGDGWEDILACGRDGVFLFRNLAGEGFRDVIDRDAGDWRCSWAELAELGRSGRPALVRLDADGLSVHLQDERGRFGEPAYRHDVPDGVGFATGDATGNGFADVYLLRRGEPGEDVPDQLLVNEGDGIDFDVVEVPVFERGQADSVTAIDHDGDGRAAFVVMYGNRQEQGPIELIAFGD